MKPTISAPPLFSLLALLPAIACAQTPSDEEELASAWGDKTLVSIATGNQQSVVRAPSTATVITAQDIQAMGASDLRQVLESVPGLHVNVSPIAYTPLFYFRGIGSAYNPEVLVLVNGKKINGNFHGNPTLLLGSFPLENIARIEVIRGPGSALYGADAFSGVINIQTKSADEVHGLEYGVRLGSFQSRDTWLQYGGKLGALSSAAYLRYGKTAGSRRIVEKDLQSNLDAVFGSHASLAPGPLNLDQEEVDARLDLAYENWRLGLGLQKRKLGTGAGLAEALDPVGKFPESRYTLDLSYQKNNFFPFWNLAASYSHFHLREPVGDPPYVLFPRGAFGGLYPDGLIGNPGHNERHHRFEFSASYTGWHEHQLRWGAGYEIEDLYKVEEYKNFTFTPVPGGNVLTPLGGIVNASGDPKLIFLTPHKHTLRYLFVQDEWKLAQDWTLTAGLRHDRYSDFGSTSNPRLALVWNASYNLVLKAIHGRAFRAPSFTDQYAINNPVAIGNPATRPEKIKSNELAAIWRIRPGLQTSLTLFQYRQSNIIQYVTDPGPNGTATAQNTGDQTGRGFELESSWDIDAQWRISGNYSYQRATDQASGKDAGLSPHHHVFLRSDWHFATLWQAGISLNHVAKRLRQPGDTRPPLADYTSVDVNVRREKLWGNWEWQLAVKNLFNRDVREPSLAPGNIPLDLPQPGRNWQLQLVYKY